MRLFLLCVLFGEVVSREEGWQPMLSESSLTYETYKPSDISLETR